MHFHVQNPLAFYTDDILFPDALCHEFTKCTVRSITRAAGQQHDHVGWHKFDLTSDLGVYFRTREFVLA